MRRTELDLCRITACVMVVLIHTSGVLYQLCPIDHAVFPILSFISTLLRGSVPVFFMLTGAMFLPRESLDVKPFLKSHALKLILLFCFWSPFYAILSRLASGNLVFDYQFFFDLAKGHYHMWFLPAMTVCYLFMPVAHAALHEYRLSIKYLLFLFFGVSILCANCNLTPDTALVLNRITLNFSLDYLPYLGYAAWGCWLSRQKLSKRWLYIAPAVFILVSCLTAAGNIWYSNYKQQADGWLFSYFSLSSLTQATMIFCFFQALQGHEFKRPRLWAELSACTLGVYLVHPMAINVLELVYPLRLESPILGLGCFTLIVTLLCFAGSFIARRIPVIKKLL